MFTQQHIELLVQLVLIIAALNWALVSYNNIDLVRIATGGGEIEKYAKFAVGAAGAYAAYQMYLAYMKSMKA
jgi:uncharacterized membrane protein YuzA (DUF378 family)